MTPPPKTSTAKLADPSVRVVRVVYHDLDEALDGGHAIIYPDEPGAPGVRSVLAPLAFTQEELQSHVRAAQRTSVGLISRSANEVADAILARLVEKSRG